MVNCVRCFNRTVHLWLIRSEKSEVLNEEQQNLVKRVELIRLVSQNVYKKLQGCQITLSLTDPDKRMVSKYFLL